jgi:hypothetical protein
VIDRKLRQIVAERALHQCEYCRTQQIDEPFLKYQVEHIVPRQHGGSDNLDNLAFACPYCNLHKGPNIAGIDPLDGSLDFTIHVHSIVKWTPIFGQG